MTVPEATPDGDPTAGFVRALVSDDPAELYEAAPCGYLSTDPAGTILKVNRAFLGWTGYAAADLVERRTFQSLLAVGDRIYHETHVAPALAMEGVVREIAAEVVCASGERLPVLLNAARKDDRSGDHLRTRIAVFDARHRRAYERELLEERRRAERAAQEARALAATLQRTLLPATLPEIDGIDVGAAYRPAGDGGLVGGDFYDVFEIHDGSWGVSLGDVCGKGARAAITTALARHTVRALAVRNDTPSEVLAGLHDAIVRSPDIDGFCTALFLTVRADGAALRVHLSAGGHPLPLRVAGGAVTEVGRTGHMLGMLEPLRLHDDAVALQPGESMVLYTDGVIEAERAGDLFGEQRLRVLLAQLDGEPAQAIADAVVAAAVGFQGGDTRDDIAVVVLQAPGGRASS